MLHKSVLWDSCVTYFKQVTNGLTELKQKIAKETFILTFNTNFANNTTVSTKTSKAISSPHVKYISG